MAKEICISSTPHETRLAILEDDQLAEIYYERENEYTLAGSIYNGRVTRVLPGMQSAFVDLGLERDAFLYVTDFIELEDQEETDELEKAAASGAGQAPREVKHPHGIDSNGATEVQGGRGGRQEERGPRRDQNRNEPRQEHRPAEETRTPAMESSRAGTAGAQEQTGAAQETDEAGSRRFRGRRRRRGGREQGGQPANRSEFEPVSNRGAEPANTAEQFPAIQAFEEAPAPRGQHAPAAFVLPGESLSKYGSTPGTESSKSTPEPAAPPRPASTFKPSTLIEAPLAWDGSGLLPGESLSLRRRGAEAPVEAAQETQENLADEPLEESRQEEILEETESPVAELRESELRDPEEAPFEFEEEELASNALETLTEDELPAHDGSDDAESAQGTPGENSAEPEEDADASHRIDPSSPTGFKLFGFGKKKKESDASSESKTAVTSAPASNYAPGNGVVEEEVIEGEELESAPHGRRHKPEVHDTDDYEEETIPSHLRTGDLGEMLQEAHLDHRIQKNFDEGGVEEDEVEGEAGSRNTAGARPRKP